VAVIDQHGCWLQQGDDRDQPERTARARRSDSHVALRVSRLDLRRALAAAA